MPIMEWQETFSVKIKEFDDHHKHLVELLNSTYDKVVAGFSSEDIDTVLHTLMDYASYHFQAEELWMLANGYPHLDAHKSQHAEFKETVERMATGAMTDKDRAFEVISFLVEWLSSHILVSDADLGRFRPDGTYAATPPAR